MPRVSGRAPRKDDPGAPEVRRGLLQICLLVCDLSFLLRGFQDVLTPVPSWYHYFTLSGKVLMAPDYDDQIYPEIKPWNVETYMKKVGMEHLSGAYFPWGSKTLKE